MKSYKKISELQKLSREVNFMVRRLSGTRTTIEDAWSLLRKLNPKAPLITQSGGIDRLILLLKSRYQVSKEILRGK